ncbi:MAG: cytochrome c [Roseiflexaceae bacterium]
MADSSQRPKPKARGISGRNLAVGALIFVVVAIFTVGALSGRGRNARTNNVVVGDQIAVGRAIYAENCAVCHGVNLEGQPNWRIPLPNGSMPAPPHDESGHTWHHPDQVLFDITKYGGQKYNTADYVNLMPAYEGRLSDAEIWAVIAYIKSTWPPEIQQAQAGNATHP